MSEAVLLITTNGYPFLVDKEDEALVAQNTWTADWNNKKTTYYIRETNGERRGLHRILLALTGNDVVGDHINGRGFDNRRSNLRPATDAQNNSNAKKIFMRAGKITESRYKGVTVYRGKYKTTYAAQLQVNGVRERWGRCETEIEAARAYDKRAYELLGEYAKLNFPNEVLNSEKAAA